MNDIRLFVRKIELERKNTFNMYKILRKFTGSRERVKNKESGGNYSKTIEQKKSKRKMCSDDENLIYSISSM
jgi:hypothetical protein